MKLTKYEAERLILLINREIERVTIEMKNIENCEVIKDKAESRSYNEREIEQLSKIRFKLSEVAILGD